jgi:hypothetical protein
MLVMYTDLRAVWYLLDRRDSQPVLRRPFRNMFLFGALVQMTLAQCNMCAGERCRHWGL